MGAARLLAALLLGLFLTGQPLAAQDPDPGSGPHGDARAALAMEDGPAKFQELARIASLLVGEDLEAARRLAAEAEGVARRLGSDLLRSQALSFRASTFAAEEDYPRALALHAEAIELARAVGNERLIAEALVRTAPLHSRLGDVDAVLAVREEAAPILEELQNHEALALLFDAAGTAFLSSGAYQRALEDYHTALGLTRRPAMRVVLLGNLGRLRHRLDDLEGAEAAYREALELGQQIGHEDGLPHLWNNLGELHRDRERFEEARQSYESARQLAGEHADPVARVVAELGLAELRERAGDPAAALERYDAFFEGPDRLGNDELTARALALRGRALLALGRPAAALGQALAARTLAESLGQSELAKSAATLESEAYEALGDEEQLVKSLREELRLEREANAQSAEDWARYEEQLERGWRLTAEKARQAAALERSRTRWASAVAVAATLLVAAILLWRANRAIRGANAALVEVNASLGETNLRLEASLARVEELSGLLPICSSCKAIRDEDGAWHRLESYLVRHSEADFTHTICPRCSSELYPEFSSADPS